MKTPPNLDTCLTALRSLPLRSPATEIRSRLFEPAPAQRRPARRLTEAAGPGLLAWLLPFGAAAMLTLTWGLTPGWSGTARASDTNGFFRFGDPQLLAHNAWAGTVNNQPPVRLTSTLSVPVPSTNVAF